MQLDPDELRGRIQPLWDENFASFGELGAATSIWQHGEPILNLHGGFRDIKRELPWTEDTIVLVWSASKGIGSACLLHVLQEHKIDLKQRVSKFWPEFAQNGKTLITIAELASHSAGLCAIDRDAEVTDYPAVIAALAAQKPLWPPGHNHGYHARTFGFLIDELVRRVSGISISRYWREVFADPLALDLWIGLPHELNSRCATIYAAKAGKPPEPAQFYRALSVPGSLQQKTFTSPRGLHAVNAMNNPAHRALDIVSFGGTGSAGALAGFYAMLANRGQLAGRSFFSSDTQAHMHKALVDGTDQVFRIPTAFSAGFLKDATGAERRIFGPAPRTFGHPGAGGSHAFCDPENGIAFSYVMNQMEQTLFPNGKSLRLVDAIYQCGS